ncbi:MAG: hypothetical protein H6Q33_1438 [Deltaproteobacteria bacterium]|nr:hypothetical protein [Deltaproteobacteria bacterium]
MRRSWNLRRFDLIELCLVGLLAGVCGLLLGKAIGGRLRYPEYTTAVEAARLRAAYGPNRFSENEEEWIIRDYFKDRAGGFFVDIGASHYQQNSNTYYLESRLNWSGIAVDPQVILEADYRKYRPRTRFFPMFVSDVSNQSAKLYIAGGNLSAVSADRSFTQLFGDQVREFTAPTISLTDLLDQLHVTSVDFLSIDVELSEPKVLASFDIDRFRPAMVCIEAHPDVRQQILDYFAAHRYVVIGRYLRVDTQNLYFTPQKP